MRTLLILFFSVSACFGQLTMQSMEPFFNGSSAGSVTNFSAAEYVWISSDITTNTTISGNWTDRIQGLAHKQGNAANQPTNSAQGIWFDDNHWLTNFMTVMGSNVAFGYIVKIMDPTDAGNIMPGFSGNDYGGNDGGGRLDLRFDSTSAHYNLAYELGQASPVSIGPNSTKWSTTNVVFDLVYVQVMTNNNTGGWFAYTNGLLMSSGNLNTTQLGVHDYFGSTAPENSANGNLRVLFKNLSVNRVASAKLFCLEHWIWTNSPPGAANGNNISAGVLADFHTRAKTYYGVSP